MQRLRINDLIELLTWAIVFLLPLIFLPSLNLTFELPKVVFFRSMVLVLTFLTALKIIQERKVTFPKFPKWIWIIFGGYFLAFGLATVFSIAPQMSFWGSYFRQQGFFTILHYGLFVILLWLNYHEEGQWRRLFNVLLISVFLTAVVGILQKFVPQFSRFWIAEAMVGRVFSTVGHPNFFSTFLVMTIFLPLKIGSAKLSIVLKTVFVVASLFAVYFTMSRGALFGLITGIFVFLIGTAIIQRKKVFLFASLGVVCAAIAGFIAINLAWNSDFVQENRFFHRFLVNGTENRSLESRFALWNAVAKMVKDRPLLGYGPETLSTAIGPYFPKKLLTLEDFNDTADRAHNNILDTLAVAGILGLLAELAIFISLLFFLKRIFVRPAETGRKYFVLALFSGLTALFIANLFGFSTTILHTIFWLFFAAMGFLAAEKISENPLRFPRWFGVTKIIITGAISVIIIFFLNIQPLRADRAFREAVQAAFGGYPETDELFIKTVSRNPHQSYYFFSWAELLLQDGHRKSVPAAFGQIERAGKFVSDQDSRYHLYRGRAYHLLKMVKEAEEEFAIASKLAPNSPPIFFEWGKFLQQEKRYKEAVEKYEYYISLAPPYWQWKNDIKTRSPEERQRYHVFYKLNSEFDEVFGMIVESAKKADDTTTAKKYRPLTLSK